MLFIYISQFITTCDNFIIVELNNNNKELMITDMSSNLFSTIKYGEKILTL